jgi:uncharacterized membrane protein
MTEFLNYLADRIGIVALLTGIIFMFAGLIMMKYPPKKINDLYGYRMPSVMKSQERWDFAQKFSSVKSFQLGVVLFVVSFLNSLIGINQLQSCIIGIGVMILGCVYMVFVTEKAIKKNFPNKE